MSEPTRDLILALADSKRLLGMRYAEWILGAPALEAGIACASMAQDEWGHGRLLYALLKDFGDDVEKLEHGREAGDYRNIELLDQAPESWTDLVILNALVDTALSVQLDALRQAEHAPLRQRVGKILDEEEFHAVHGAAWLRRIAGASPDTKRMIDDAVAGTLPVILRWFGRDGDVLRAAFLHRVQPLLSTAGSYANAGAPDFGGFNEATRRSHDRGPDAATIARIRGDKNRAFLMD